MNVILNVSKASRSTPRTTPPLEPDFLTKITFHVRVKQKQGELNTFLRAMQAYPPLGPVFFSENCMQHESQT